MATLIRFGGGDNIFTNRSKRLFPLRMLAGLMDFSILGADNLTWYFPDGTTSLSSRPSIVLPEGGIVYATCDDFSKKGIIVSDNNTNENYIGNTTDFPDFTGQIRLGETDVSGDIKHIKMSDTVEMYTTNVSGELDNLLPITVYLDLRRTNITGAYTQVNGLNVPNQTYLDYTNMTSTNMDLTLIAYANCTKSNGVFRATGMTRTSASDTAVATLVTRGWTVSGITTV